MPTPVIRPSRAQISCIAAISGNENSMVHSIPNPNCAPPCEYVAIPLGSSSAAPEISPGPRRGTISAAAPAAPPARSGRTLVVIQALHATCAATFTAALLRKKAATNSATATPGWRPGVHYSFRLLLHRRASSAPKTPRDQLDFFRGTLAPFFRASESPIAIACFLLVTRPPFPPLPDLSVPRFLRCIALFTVFPASLP